MDIVGRFQSALKLHREGALGEAETLYREVLDAEPTHFQALDLLGVLCVMSGRFEAAAGFLRRAVAEQPGRGGTYAYLGFALRRIGRPAEAVAALTRAVELGHRDAEALNSRGVALLDLARFEDAAADFEAALELAPDMAMAVMNLGIALTGLARHEEALKRFDHAAALAPNDPKAWFRRGGALKVLRRFDAAGASFERAIALEPGSAHAHHLRSECLVELGRPEDGLSSIGRALELAPDLAAAHQVRGAILVSLGRHAEAAECFSRALAIEPGQPDALLNRALCRLALGEFREGWQDYEHRWRVPSFVRSSRGLVDAHLQTRIDPAISRADVAGRDVLVAAEQGVGDVLMFAGAMPDLIAEARQVTLLAERRLHRLLEISFPTLKLLDSPPGATVSQSDVFLPMASLGRLYRNELSDFPQAPYLSARPEVRAAWRKRLGPRRGLRIGVSWRGGTPISRKAERSMALDQLRPLFDLPDCEFVSLQYGDVADELAEWNARSLRPVWAPPAAHVEDFEDLAGLVQELDLIVSVQTAIVHLAGALGVPALVMVPRNPEWRYAASGSSTPWYRSVTIYRQDSDESRDAVVARVVQAVQARLGRTAP